MMSDQTPRKRRKIAGERRQRGSSPPSSGDQGPSEPAAQDSSADREPDAPTPATSPFARRSDRPGDAGPGAPPGDTGGGVGGFGHVPGWLLVGLGVLLAAAVVFDLVVGLRSHTEAEERTSSTAAITSALRQAPTEAETAAVRVLAYDYKTLQTDADEAKSLMTSDYAAKFQKTVDDLLKAPADQVKAHVEADVKASGVVSADAATVKVMLFVDQTSQTTAEAQPQTYLNRVVFTMVKQDDRWLVDDVTAL